MRLLSLAIAFTLLFSPCAIATGESDFEVSGGGRGAFDWNDVDKTHQGWGRVQTKFYVGIKITLYLSVSFLIVNYALFTGPIIVEHAQSHKVSKKNIRGRFHPAMILGSSKASGGKELYFAPMSSTSVDNDLFISGKSALYLSGPKVDDKSVIHIGRPFKTEASNIRALSASEPPFMQTPEQKAKYYHDVEQHTS
ncbi:hypothetical protein F5887DRAFT_110791 [Amanita rubescens]|nr:hypothetical protein F5887DRAFT_110791 [Amanita rubescens]